jgi:hypothetical protein
MAKVGQGTEKISPRRLAGFQDHPQKLVSWSIKSFVYHKINQKRHKQMFSRVVYPLTNLTVMEKNGGSFLFF